MDASQTPVSSFESIDMNHGQNVMVNNTKTQKLKKDRF